MATRLLLCGHPRADRWPVDGGLDLPKTDPIVRDTWSARIVEGTASIHGELASDSDLDLVCRPRSMRTAFDGTVEATGRVELAIDEPTTVDEMELESGWIRLSVPTSVPVFVFARVGATVAGQADVDAPMRIRLSTEATATGPAALAFEDQQGSVQPPESWAIESRPEVSGEGPVSLRTRLGPFVDVRLYGFVGFRLSARLDLGLRSEARCDVSWKATAQVQAVIGHIHAPQPLFVAPAIPIPLPASVAEGARKLDCRTAAR